MDGRRHVNQGLFVCLSYTAIRLTDAVQQVFWSVVVLRLLLYTPRRACQWQHRSMCCHCHTSVLPLLTRQSVKSFRYLVIASIHANWTRTCLIG